MSNNKWMRLVSIHGVWDEQVRDLTVGKTYAVVDKTEHSCTVVDDVGDESCIPSSNLIDVSTTTGRFEQLGAEIGRLTDEKNAAYGSSVDTSVEAMRLLYPKGITPEQYADVLLQVRIWDKQMRIANRKDAFGENPYRDVAGYGLLGAGRSKS